MVAILDTPWTHRMALRGFSAPIQSGRVHYNQLISLRYRSKYAKARGPATLPPPPPSFSSKTRHLRRVFWFWKAFSVTFPQESRWLQCVSLDSQDALDA